MGKPDGQGGGRTAADPRFAAMHSDPRFQRFPKQKNKIVVDERFAGMFNDPEFQTHSVVDKRGRKIEPRRRNEEIKRYYRLKDEDEWRQGGSAVPAENGAGGDKDDDAGAGAKDAPAAARKAGKKAGPPAKAAEDGADAPATVAAVAVKGTKPPKAAKQQKQQAQGAVAGKEEGRKAQQSIQQKLKQQKHREEQVKKGEERRQVRKAVAAAETEAGVGNVAEPQVDREEEEEESEEAVSQEEEEDEQQGEGEEESEEEEEGGDDEARARDRWARARGMIVSESDDSDNDEDDAGEEAGEYDSADEPLTEEEYESDEHLDPEEWGAGAHALNPEEPIPPQEETRRLALVDLDWDHVRAVDILAALRSFLPRGATVQRVTVYPSDYGLQRMAEEAAMGPKLILKPSQPAHGAAKAPAQAENGGAQQGPKSRKGGAGRGAEEEDSGAEVDKKRLAAYEKSRLRYYYAIVECDCIATALHLYNECDGMEFERSACKFDMRFVPDDQSFKERQVRDTATDVPPGYQPPAHFNISLQHTDPKLSWDAEDPERKRKLQGRRLKTDEQLLEADFAAYLGSEDDDEEEEQPAADPEGDEGAGAAGRTGNGSGAHARGESAEALRQRYRALLLGGETKEPSGNDRTKGRVGGKSWLGSEDGEEEDEGEAAEEGRGRRVGGAAGEPSTSGRGDGGRGGKRGDVDMMVTFHSGLEGLGERLKKKKEEERARAGETVWEAYLRKKREKRAQRKAQGRLRNLSDSEDSDDYISDGEEERGGKGAAAKKDKDKAAKLTRGKGRGGDDGDDDGDLYGEVASDDPFFKQDDGDDPFADPFFNEQDGGPVDGEADSEQEDGPAGKVRRGESGKAKGEKASKKKANNQAAGQADLELLMMDDAALRDAARGVKTRVLPAGHDAADEGNRKLTKKEKREQKKEVKKRARAGSDEEDAAAGGEESTPGFAVNLQDPRFAEMFASAEYALDPTDPRFKKMQAREKVLTEAQKRRSQQPKTTDNSKSRSDVGSENVGAAAKESDAVPGRGSDLRLMVAKLKRKAEAQQDKERSQALGKVPKKSRL